MVNWDYLSDNMTELNLSNITDNLNDPAVISQVLIDNTDVVTKGYFGLGVMLITFIVLVMIIFRDDGDIKMDIARSIMFSSGFTTIIGVICLVLDIFSSFVHVMWFFVIFLVSIISILYLKKKGL